MQVPAKIFQEMLFSRQLFHSILNYIFIKVELTLTYILAFWHFELYFGHFFVLLHNCKARSLNGNRVSPLVSNMWGVGGWRKAFNVVRVETKFWQLETLGLIKVFHISYNEWNRWSLVEQNFFLLTWTWACKAESRQGNRLRSRCAWNLLLGVIKFLAEGSAEFGQFNQKHISIISVKYMVRYH